MKSQFCFLICLSKRSFLLENRKIVTRKELIPPVNNWVVIMSKHKYVVIMSILNVSYDHFFYRSYLVDGKFINKMYFLACRYYVSQGHFLLRAYSRHKLENLKLHNNRIPLVLTGPTCWAFKKGSKLAI